MIVWQAVMETALRLTHVRRDSVLKRCFAHICLKTRRTKKRSTITIPLEQTIAAQPRDFNDKSKTSERASFETSPETPKLAFYSIMILAEMMAEYTGIVIAFFLVFFWQNHRLYWIFQYCVVTGSLDQPPNLRPLAETRIMQFFGEILVDTICIYFERRTNPLVAWRALMGFPKSFTFLYGFVSLVSSSLRFK